MKGLALENPRFGGLSPQPSAEGEYDHQGIEDREELQDLCTEDLSHLTEEERRLRQRAKQIGFGFNTRGYQNMLRLLEHDPRLRNGGVLPLQPPPAELDISKKRWDVLIRKWRRALHMFDHIHLEGDGTSLADVVESQRQQWVSPRFANLTKLARVTIRRDDIFAARASAAVPKKLPVEDAVRPWLRSTECYDPIHNWLPENAPQNTTPQIVGIKILIAPLGGSGSGTSPTAAFASRAPRSRSVSPRTSPRQSRSPSPTIDTVPKAMVSSTMVEDPRHRSPPQPSTPLNSKVPSISPESDVSPTRLLFAGHAAVRSGSPVANVPLPQGHKPLSPHGFATSTPTAMSDRRFPRRK